nr:hypothetical protein [Tanacetum cinerariifolium]
MLDEEMYNSRKSHMFLYIKRKKNDRVMLESIKNEPLFYLTVEVDGQIIKKKYTELTEQEQLQVDCDVQATNIVLQGDDLIACLNKAMAFMVIVQQVYGRHGQSSSLGIIGEGHMARQCNKPKGTRNSAWFKEKMLLVQAQESGQVLDEEQLAFLADLGITDCHDVQPTIIHNAAFQTDDLDAFDFDCDDISSVKVVLMANLSGYGLDVLSEDATTVDINAIALLRQAIRSSPRRNIGTTSLELIVKTKLVAGKHVDIVVDDKVLHKLVSMVENNDLFKELMIVVMDTELNLADLIVSNQCKRI